MAPARNHLRRQCDGHGGCFAVTISEFHQERDPVVLVPNSMAEEEEEGDGNLRGWLQLGIGSHPSTSSSSSTGERTRSAELNLFPERPPLPTVSSANPSIRPGTTGYSYGQVGSSSTLRPVGEFRVVRPPPRPQAGVWFELKAAENQGKQPFFPQIPKSYLRIKDGRMTVRLVMKYLANKLELNDESQAYIHCSTEAGRTYLSRPAASPYIDTATYQSQCMVHDANSDDDAPEPANNGPCDDSTLW